MRKWLLGVVIAFAALAVVAGGALTAAILSRSATRPIAAGAWYEFRMGVGRHVDGNLAPMHEAMLSALADGLGISQEELEERLESGESLATVAEAEGLSEEELSELVSEAQSEALQAGVDQGLLTQEQADSMLEHMQALGGMRGWPMIGGSRFPFHRGGMMRWPSAGRFPTQP